MVTYVPRSGWTSTSASGSTLTGAKLRGVAVHWPGTTQDIIGTSGIKARLRAWRDYHVDVRGWRDIGYTFAIDQAGRVYALRSTTWWGNMIGAHAASTSNRDANEEYVGVLLVVGDREAPSTAMIAAFRNWYRNRFLPHWSGRTDVRGHRQVPGAQTLCPGDRVIAHLDELKAPEDDMFDPNEHIPAIARAVSRHRITNPLNQDEELFHETYLRYAWRDGKWLLRGQAQQLAELRAIRRAVGAQIDEEALARDIATLLAPMVIEALSDTAQLTEEQVEAATRQVLGSLDAAAD